MAILTLGLEALEPPHHAQCPRAASERRQGDAAPDMGDRVVGGRPILGQQGRDRIEAGARRGGIASKPVCLRGDERAGHDGLEVRVGCGRHHAKQRKHGVRAALPQQQDQALMGERPASPSRIDFQR